MEHRKVGVTERPEPKEGSKKELGEEGESTRNTPHGLSVLLLQRHPEQWCPPPHYQPLYGNHS